MYAYLIALITTTGCVFYGFKKLSSFQKDRRRKLNAAKCKDKQIKALIVGAGFSGLAAALKLKEMGIPFEIIDKAGEVGGTWNENLYPGCQCDIPSYLYSLSSYPAPRGGWKKHFSDQPQILDYIKEVVTHFDLRKLISFNTSLTACQWNSKLGKWTVSMSQGGVESTKDYSVVFAATGPLHVPNFPEIPGMDSFKGDTMHTAQWNTSLDLKGKKIAVVGSAASAVQLIPFVADIAKEMHVFQRTPNWIAPKFDVEYYPSVKFALTWVPALQYLIRFLVFLRQECVVKLLMRGGRFATMIQGDVVKYIKKSNPNIDSKKLIPPYKMGCKRVLMSNSYFPALNKQHVQLHTEGIERLTPTGLITKEGENIDADVIIWATGFDIRATFKGAFDCKGQDGADLKKYLNKGAEAYLGSVFPNFPNLFTLLGPNTGLGHNSVVYMCEAQLEYIQQLLTKLVDAPEGTSIGINTPTVKSYNDGIQSELKDYVWNGCSSWYRNEDGKIDSLYPGTAYSFMKRCNKSVDWSQHVVTCASGSKL